MAEYRLSPAAARDLDDIFDYTVEHWGLDQAGRYTDLLRVACEELAQTPNIAPACDDIRAGYRRRRVERHVIYFRITPYGIAITRILHDRMDMGRHLQST